MEIISLEGYTEQEKVIIAFRYLVPRQITENGLTAGQDIEFADDAVRFLVRRYTREAGVRSLERQIGAICRKQARRIAEGAREKVLVTPVVVEKDLGAPRYRTDTEVADRTRRPGGAVGLAWTPVGGEVLFIEAGRMPGGSKGLIMTGQLGPVMQESVQAALTWVRGNATKYGIDPDLFKTSDIHIHVPAGAIPKDGPSEGITMATAPNVRRADDPVWRVSSHVFGGALANYIQLDIIESCGRCVSLVIRSSACETLQRARGMMRAINSTKFSEATSPTTSSRCPPSARVSRRFAFRTQAAPTA